MIAVGSVWKAVLQLSICLACVLHPVVAFSSVGKPVGTLSPSSKFVQSASLHRHSNVIPNINYQFSSSKMQLSAGFNGLPDDGNSGVIDVDVVSEPNKGLFRRSKQNLNNFSRGIVRWMTQLTQWRKNKRIRSLFAAAVLSFSLFFVSQQRVDNYYAQAPNSHSAPMERVQPSQPREFAAQSARGGSAVKPGKEYHDLAIFKSKESNPLLLAEEATLATTRTFKEAMVDLKKYMRGPKSDALILLFTTALVTPLCKKFGTNPILGFLATGMILGPNGLGLIRGIHTTEVFAELGIVFFLFEMGIELSIERLMQMRKDVFGLGLGQYLLTAAAFAGIGNLVGLPANAQIVIGGGLALSSSAFVLQLLKDKNQLATRFGKASFGILLFQDLAVVPLLVVTPILAGSGTGLAAAVGSALLKAGMSLGAIAIVGRFLLNPFFKTVAEANSQEAFLGLVMLTVLSMSFMTEGLGLSNTLGAFLAGVLLSETKYKYQVEADIAPFRGILLGLFFVTVGYEIDLRLIAGKLPVVGSLVIGIMAIKAAITTALSLGFGLSVPTSVQTGLLISQGGEFAFVAFGLARSLGILDGPTTKLLLTSGSLTMALTPLMASLGGKIAKKLEESKDFTHYLGQDTDANEIKNSDGFAIVVGYGQVGKVVCNLLDVKLIKYVGLEINPNKAIQARNLGLPVFYGDIGRQEVAEAFNVGKAKMVIVCIADKAQSTRVVIALRRWYPDLKIFCRAVDKDHQTRLQNTLNVAAMVPVLPEDTLMMTLPFGAAVMRSLGVPMEEVSAIIERKKREVLQERNVQDIGEEAILAQLGVGDFSYSGDVEDYNVRDQIKDKAAAERRQQALEKSPFVAKVIQDACPDSVSDGVEVPAKIVDAVVVKETVVPPSKPNDPDTPATPESASFDDGRDAFQ